MDNSKDRLGNAYEPLFHFVKVNKGYYYDVDSIRNKPSGAKVVNGAVVSATGVTGVKYKRKIELSTVLTKEQKANAYDALEDILTQIQQGKLSDYLEQCLLSSVDIIHIWKLIFRFNLGRP